MPVGRGFTAVARQVPRLAGLVRLPAAWPIQTAIRRQASWLAIKASVDLISRWPLALQKYPSYAEATHHARCAPAYRHPGKGKAAHSSPPQKFPRCTEASHPARGAPASRQLRGSRAAIGSGGKKARPFCRRKKVSTGARTNVGVHYLTRMRATLRAPPSKWAIGAFFPESPCRWLSFAHFSFATERKV